MLVQASACVRMWGERNRKRGRKASDGEKNRRTGSGGGQQERFREVMSLPWQRASHAQSHHQQSQIHLCLIGAGSLVQGEESGYGSGHCPAADTPCLIDAFNAGRISEILFICFELFWFTPLTPRPPMNRRVQGIASVDDFFMGEGPTHNASYCTLHICICSLHIPCCCGSGGGKTSSHPPNILRQNVTRTYFA